MSEEKTARVVWREDSLSFKTTLGSGYEMEMKSPAGEEGGGPMEVLLAGVAGCTAIDIVHTLRKMRQPLAGLEVEICGVRAPDYPMVYTDVEIIYVVKGEEVSPASVERAIRLSYETYCSASIMLKRAGATVNTSYRIEPQ